FHLMLLASFADPTWTKMTLSIFFCVGSCLINFSGGKNWDNSSFTLLLRPLRWPDQVKTKHDVHPSLKPKPILTPE
ncbi:hypothetical protein KI387_002439, partial [Taxus chinensis]